MYGKLKVLLGLSLMAVAPGAFAVALTTLRAPEIDPASAASGLMLLLGGLAVVRGRSGANRVN